MHPETRRWLIYALLGIFMLYGFVLNIIGSEPYPAIIFPGFREVGSEDRMIEFDKPEFTAYRNGQGVPLLSEDILIDIPPANHPTVVLHRFRYGNGEGGKTVKARVGGAKVVVQVTHWPFDDKVVEEWEMHVQKAIKETKGFTADSLVVEWFHHAGKEGTWNTTPLEERLALNFSKGN
jgi:hypothetical protein